MKLLKNHFNLSFNITLYTFFTRILVLNFIMSGFGFADTNSTNDQALSIQRSQHKTETNAFSFLREYKATYEVYYGDDLVGLANEELTFLHNEWKLQMQAKLKKFFFKVNSTEFSEFIIDNGELVTQRFYSKTKMTFKKDKVIEQIFDWKNKIETGTYKGKSWRIPLNKKVFDRMSQTIQLRSDLRNKTQKELTELSEFDYSISHRSKKELYQYKYMGSSVISTAFGDYKAIKLVRDKANGDKFAIWFSPELNYFPLKISQKEKDKKEVFFLLKDLALTSNLG